MKPAEARSEPSFSGNNSAATIWTAMSSRASVIPCRFFFCLCIALLAVTAPMFVADANAVPSAGCLPAGIEDKFRGLIEEPGFGVALAGGLAFDTITIEPESAVYSLISTQTEGEEALRARIVLEPRAKARESETVSASFVVRPHFVEDSPDVRRAIDTAMASIVERDDGAFYVPCSIRGGDGAGTGVTPRARYRVFVILALLGAAAVAGRIATRSREKPD
jgi:hypothetical protein